MTDNDRVLTLLLQAGGLGVHSHQLRHGGITGDPSARVRDLRAKGHYITAEVERRGKRHGTRYTLLPTGSELGGSEDAFPAGECDAGAAAELGARSPTARSELPPVARSGPLLRPTATVGDTLYEIGPKGSKDAPYGSGWHRLVYPYFCWVRRAHRTPIPVVTFAQVERALVRAERPLSLEDAVLAATPPEQKQLEAA